MVDITLRGNTIFIVFSTDFINEGFKKQWNNRKDDRKGVFVVNNSSLGYDGCLKLVSFDSKIVTYKWDLPQQKDFDCQCVQYPRVGGYCDYCKNEKKFHRIEFDDLNCFVYTITDLFFYEFDARYPKPSLIENQGFDLCAQMNAEAGRVYPSLIAFMRDCNDETFQKFKEYTNSEIDRVHTYVWGKHSDMIHHIQRYTFEFHLPGNGIWLQLDNYTRLGLRTFSFNNVDSSIDFFCAIVGLMAMNTFLKDNQK